MNTGNWGDFVAGVSARIDEIIDQTQDMTPSFEAAGIFKKDIPDDLIYRTYGVTGFGYLEDFDEETRLRSDRTYPAYKTEYMTRPKGKVVSISQLLAKVRPKLLEEKLAEVKQLRIAATRTLNKWAWQILNNSFSATNLSSNFPISRLNDGVSMVSTAHPSKVPGVSNRSNRLPGNPSYSETAQNTAMLMLQEQLNGRGLPIGYEGRYLLVVPPALLKQATEVNKSTLRSGTANNDVNYYEGKVDVVSSVYLNSANGGSNTAWWMIAVDAPEEQAMLRYVPLIEPKIEQEVDFMTKNIVVSIDMSCAFGYSNFEYIVGSDGSNT